MSAPKRMFRVELFIEVPDSITPPNEWDWGALVNHPAVRNKDRTPVQFVLATPIQSGKA